jgi:DNA-binding NarL/FixJ family response regulator
MRVVIAEDSIFRNSIAEMLSDGGHQVVYAARNGNDLLTYLSRSDPPEVAVLDIRMPPTRTDEGVVTAERIRIRWPAVGILLFSAYLLVPMAERLLDLDGDGGLGYLHKDSVSDERELSDAAERVGRGEQVLDPQLVRGLLRRQREKSLEDLLTDREFEALRLIAEGRTNKMIAKTLFVTEKTVEDYCRSVFRKLDVAGEPGYNQRVRAVLEWFRRTR